MPNKIKDIFEKVPKNTKKLVLLVAAGVIAILMIASSELYGNARQNKSTDVHDYQLDGEYEEELEKRLETILSEIEGVGAVKVMLKTASGKRNEYAVNDTVNYGVSGDRKSENEYVIIKNQNNQSGMLIKCDYPEIQGVIIVCEGGDSSKVKNEVTNAVCALLGVSSNSVSVTKMKAGKE